MLRDSLLVIAKGLEIGIKFAIKFCSYSNDSKPDRPAVTGLMTIEDLIVYALSQRHGQI
jgi:hypothetical protein